MSATFAGISYPKPLWVLPEGKLVDRLARRKAPRLTGGYYQADPAPVGKGAGRMFYLDSDFQPGLRWTWADEVEGVRIDHTGWFTDEYGDFDKIRGLVFRLPHDRGFLAAWSMGEGMASEVEYHIYDDIAVAARAADDLARWVAENQREQNECDDDAA